MIFLSELEIETKIPEHIIFNHFNKNNIHVGSWYCGKKFLGFGVSNKVGSNYLKETREATNGN